MPSNNLANGFCHRFNLYSFLVNFFIIKKMRTNEQVLWLLVCVVSMNRADDWLLQLEANLKRRADFTKILQHVDQKLSEKLDVRWHQKFPFLFSLC
jgi:hypothetical protein